MGILDEIATPWNGLGMLNGDTVVGLDPRRVPPFGFAPPPDARSQPVSQPHAGSAEASATGAASENLGTKLRHWWFGGLPPTRDAHGDLSEANMFNDPISCMAKGIPALPQQSMDATQDSAAYMSGGRPHSLSIDGDYHDPLPGGTAETAMTMMGGASPIAVRGAAGGTRAAVSEAPIRSVLDVGAASGEPRTLDSRSARLYNPPAKPPRPFEADYPGGGTADEAGRLQFDIDGRPLIGAHISGRRLVRGADEAILPSQLAAVSEGSIGSIPQASEAAALPRDTVGTYHETPGPDGPERSINYLRTLNPPTAEKVIAHELGHGLDETAGQIPTSGPQHTGYKGDDVRRELMAEAIRAYMINPNYIKTVAPQTAARIREHVNSNPRLNRTIRFNTGGAPFFVPPDQDQ
jgi:hypothetical protein